MADSDFEETLLQIPVCYIFKLPPRSSAEGHKAAEWEGNQIWAGKLRIVGIGEKCQVQLEDSKTGATFAVAPIYHNFEDADLQRELNPLGIKSVEPVSDSSRYFVLRIENAGNHAYVGVGFSERSVAFDFNVAIQDHKKHIERMRKPAPDFENEEKKDYGLKEGETIKINLNVKNAKTGDVRKASGSSPAPSSGGLAANGALLPPPSSGKSRATHAKSPQPQQQQSSEFSW